MLTQSLARLRVGNIGPNDAAACPTPRYFVTAYRAVRFFGDCDETFDAERKLCIANFYIRCAKSSIL